MSQHTRLETLPLFAPRARNTDPETSHEAAASMVDGAAAQRERVLAILREHGPLIADEIDEIAGWRATTAGRRLSELAELGHVRVTQAKRKTRSGRNAFVWEVV